jgi:hypothetical protein
MIRPRLVRETLQPLCCIVRLRGRANLVHAVQVGGRDLHGNL